MFFSNPVYIYSSMLFRCRLLGLYDQAYSGLKYLSSTEKNFPELIIPKKLCSTFNANCSKAERSQSLFRRFEQSLSTEAISNFLIKIVERNMLEF